MFIVVSQRLLLFISTLSLLYVTRVHSFSAVNKPSPIDNSRFAPSTPPPSPSNQEPSQKKDDDMSLAAPILPNEAPVKNNAILRVHGPDANGIVAAFSQLLYGHGCGIVESEQHTDHSAGLFFQRIRFDWSKMHTDHLTLTGSIKEVCERFQMEYQLNWGDKRKKVCVMVSKYDHCLWELLLRHRAGELDCDISLIISNHPDLQSIAESFGIPFHLFRVTKDTKTDVEAQELALMKEHDIDLVILARYMQIITDDFCAAYPVINIHHSFLPAFIGGKPYHRAHERGVKVGTLFCDKQCIGSSYVKQLDLTKCR
jgi:formyltetrahydrofolate deformylase